MVIAIRKATVKTARSTPLQQVLLTAFVVCFHPTAEWRSLTSVGKQLRQVPETEFTFFSDRRMHIA